MKEVVGRIMLAVTGIIVIMMAAMKPSFVNEFSTALMLTVPISAYLVLAGD